MNFLKSVFNSSNEFANAAGEVPPYSVIESESKGNDNLEVYHCNYKYNNLKELEYICLHNGIPEKEVNDKYPVTMIRSKLQNKTQIDQYGNAISVHSNKDDINFIISANNFVTLYHNENSFGANNIMINILKVYDRFDSFVCQNVDMIHSTNELGSSQPYLDYSILKMFRLIVRNNFGFSAKNLHLDDVLHYFIDSKNMNIKLYIEGLVDLNTTGKSGADLSAIKLLNQKFPNIKSLNDINTQLSKLLEKHEIIKVIEFINRVEDTSVAESDQLIKSLLTKIKDICDNKNKFNVKLWQVGVIDKIIDRYNLLKKENLEIPEPNADFEKLETNFFKFICKIVEYDNSQLVKYDYLFIDYIRNNPEGKENIVNMMIALNVCFEVSEQTESYKFEQFPSQLFTTLQAYIRNNKINTEENLNIVRLFLLLLKKPAFNDRLTEKFICNDVLRLVSEISKQSSALDAQGLDEIKSINYLIVVLVLALKPKILSFYGGDRGYTILISAVLQNSNIKKSTKKTKSNRSLLYDLSILQILKNEVSNWPTDLIVTKLMPVQSLMSLLLNNNDSNNEFDDEVAEANREISQSAFDIYLHILSRVANEGGFKIIDNSKPMFSEIDKSISEVTNVRYYKQIVLETNEDNDFEDSWVPNVMVFDNQMNTKNHTEHLNNSTKSFAATEKKSSGWDNWDETEDLEDEVNAITRNIEKVKVAPKPAPKRIINKQASASKKTILRTDTRKIPVIKKKEPIKTKKSAFPSFNSDDDDGEDNWGDEW
ncbi:hypothetical protein DAHU10_032260 [Hanseniaspora uvarum]|nr:hypothetical protein DAHU10_032260 [Hanseniaspora uvarum]